VVEGPEPGLSSSYAGAGPLEQARALAEAARALIHVVGRLGMQRYQAGVEQEQELLAGLADMLIELYAMDSALARAERHPSDVRRDLAVAWAHASFERVEAHARGLLAAMGEDDEIRTALALLHGLAARQPINRVALGRRIASRLLEGGGYAL
jgi:hypothetical protein